MKFFGAFFLVLLCSFAQAQLRYTKLVLQPKQVFSFGESDILVVDTLIMMDSSSLVLNKTKKESYLHAKVMRIGKNCFIDGNGSNGKAGKQGSPGNSSYGPCRNGTNGEDATNGEDGSHGLDLLIYVKDIRITGQLSVLLDGGNGGNGGNGGEGGSAGSGTIHCKGGDGGNGGKGGNGGVGGNGGKLLVHVPIGYHSLVSPKIKINVRGGQFGKGGRGGYSGAGGLGPRGKTGRNGLQGSDGYDGSLGNYGTISFADN